MKTEERLSELALIALNRADAIARKYGHDFLCPDHMLLGLFDSSVFVEKALRAVGIDGKKAVEAFTKIARHRSNGLPRVLPYTRGLAKVMTNAFMDARARQEPDITAQHLMLAMMTDRDCFPELLRELNADPAAIRKNLLQELDHANQPDLDRNPQYEGV